MSGARDKDRLSGWTAFDLKQRREQGLLPRNKEDPFPPMPANLMTHRESSRNSNFLARPFSEVLKPDVSFPPFRQNKNYLDLMEVRSSAKENHNEVTENIKHGALKQLEELHPWADSSLIMDVLSSAENNVNKASTLLKEMVSESVSSVLLVSSDGQSSAIDKVKYNGKEQTDIWASHGNELSANAANLEMEKLVKLYNVVTEPEWEDDDVYPIHRRDALQMMRSASRHSRAATNAVVRGDHFSAQKHAMKAEEERLTAERLNARAARDILSIRNSGNDFWKLDLHGLHAAEAKENPHKVIENSKDGALKQLEELHPWADSSLIMDVLSSAENNVIKASTLLKEMVPESGTSLLFVSSDGQSSKIDKVKYNGKEQTDIWTSHGNELSANAANMEMEKLLKLYNVVTEPEWEEDDVYLIHRRDALRMMRSASRHSRAATNAFIRGDHFSAQKHAMKAEEERLTAERLNARAARDILSIRNSGNDIWKLDLHGLHAAEAVHALQERLKELENHLPWRGTVSLNGVTEQNPVACSSSANVYNNKDRNDLDKKQTSFGNRPHSLEVITGVGNNSRGEAALPAAVRSFLIESRYRFIEVRPGVIMVWLKFRLT